MTMPKQKFTCARKKFESAKCAHKSIYARVKCLFTCTLADFQRVIFRILLGCNSADFGGYDLKRYFLRVLDQASSLQLTPLDQFPKF
jgi:hypothetical protein